MRADCYISLMSINERFHSIINYETMLSPASEMPCTLRTTVSSERGSEGCGVTHGVGVVAFPSLELKPVRELRPVVEIGCTYSSRSPNDCTRGRVSPCKCHKQCTLKSFLIIF